MEARVSEALNTEVRSCRDALDAELLRKASKPVEKIVKFISANEARVLRELEEKHGVGRWKEMAKDMKLNKFQLTAGQIKKKLECMHAQ